jgi:tripartite ATP-independent transporter DctP family solute receptor
LVDHRNNAAKTALFKNKTKGRKAMKKRLLATLLVLILIASLAVPAYAKKDDTVELLIGGVTSMNAKDAVTKFIELVEEYSNGTIKCVDFPDNQLGNDEQRWEMTQTGECDISIGSTSSVASSYNDFYIFDTPYLFLSRDEVFDVGFAGEAGQAIIDGVEELGLKGLALWENGFRNVTTNNKEINSLADLKGLKLRTMDNAIHLAAWKAMGANPTPMAFSEVFTALQQGTVDGQENPYGIIVGNKFEEVEKYAVETRHSFTPYYVVMNLDRWNSLTPEQQDAVTKAMAEATQYEKEQSAKYEEEDVGTIEAAGCKVIKLSDDALAEFKAAADSADCASMAMEKMEHPELGQKLIDELNAARG